MNDTLVPQKKNQTGPKQRAFPHPRRTQESKEMKPTHPFPEKLDLVFTTKEILRIGLRKGARPG